MTRNWEKELRIHTLEQTMIRHIQKLNSESWKRLPWKKFRKNLFRLQKRVYKAVRERDTAKARSLQKLILRSQAARFLAIRQVTQLNNGKKTAGIDGKLALTYKERFELEQKLKPHATNWKHQKLRSIPIPKKDGSKRVLKVPTISDRAWQCLAKFALEPAHEATFSERSYGFRPGRPKILDIETVAKIQQELSDPEGFNSYQEVKLWLLICQNIEISYSTIHRIVRYELRGKLKIPRPIHEKQKLGVIEAFKNYFPKRIKGLIDDIRGQWGDKLPISYWFHPETRLGYRTLIWSQNN